MSFVRPATESTSQSQRKRKRSEDHDIKFDDIKLGEVYTVTVKSVKSLQLNVQLSRKVRGVYPLFHAENLPVFLVTLDFLLLFTWVISISFFYSIEL